MCQCNRVHTFFSKLERMTALLFDLEGVVMQPRTTADTLRIQRALGAEDTEWLWAVYEELRPAYESGDVSDQRWWQQVAMRAGAHDPDVVEAMVADWESLVRPNHEVVERVRELCAADYICGVIADLPASAAEKMRAYHLWLEGMDAVIFSCDIGITQDDVRAFEVAVDAMGATPKDTIFFSANPKHLAAAERAGVQAREFHSMKEFNDLQL